MKKFIFLFALAMLVLATPVAAREQGHINVNGEGIVSIEPDVAFITLGVETQETSAAEAQRNNSRKMAAVIEVVKGLGIDEADIQSAHFSMHPRHDWMQGTGEIIGYQVSNSVRVTVRDIEQVGTVLSTAAEAGANMSSHIVFDVQDATAAYNQALAQAVVQAREKAQVLATAMDVRLGAVVSVTETSGRGFMPVQRFAGDMMAVAASPAMVEMAVPVQAGELNITAQVQITFGILQ